MNIDKLFVSSDLNPKFINFWPVVSESWRRIFAIEPTLVIVSKKAIDLKLLELIESFGACKIIISKSHAPIENQAKLARWFEACKVNDEIAMIEDIDTIFLRDNYLVSRLSKFKNGELLGIGSEVYSEDSSKQGKFPASNLTGEGKIFADLFGYVKGESFENFVEKFNQHPVFDEMENPFNIPIKFSDESLIRALRSRNNFKNISVIPRDLNAHKYWIDRSWWPANQMILSEHELVNFPRPLYENRKKCEFILKFFYPEGYPWIIRKRTNIFTNQDGKFKKLQKRILRKLSKLIQTLINNLNTLRGN